MGLKILALLEAATVTGPAKNLLDFCRTARGCIEVSIATFTRNGAAPPALASAAAEAGVPLHLIAETSAFDRGVIGRIRALAAELQPDIVQTHAVKSHFLVYLSRLWKTCPWVAFHHGYTTTDLKMRLYNQLDRVSLRAPARLVTVSRAFERQLLGQGIAASRITVLHNAIDPGWAGRVMNIDREHARRGLGLASGESALVAIGRMSQEKAHIDLIRAYHRLRAKRVPARLILVGDGPERTNLERVAGDGVVFTGQVHDTTPFYAAADVMVLPSLTEGSPNVLLEAMAVNVPVVATAVGGTPEIVTDRESALLVAPRDPSALAQAIEEVLARPDLRAALTARARSLIAERHSLGARAGALLDLYIRVGTREDTP